MAFDFLKKTKKSSKDSLEVPAPPPPPKPEKKELPRFEKQEESEQMAPPVLDDNPFIPDKKPGKIDFSAIQKDMEDMPQKPAPLEKSHEPEPISTKPKPKPAYREKEVSEVKEGLRSSAIGEDGVFYLNIDEYKKIFHRIDAINEKLKALENTTMKIDKIGTKEKEVFQKWHHCFEDMRKKMIFIDEVLFER